MGSSEAVGPHTEAGDRFGRSDPEGESQLSRRVVHVGIALKPTAAGGRLSAELRGAWNFKPYRGKPAVRNFRGGRLETWPWEPD